MSSLYDRISKGSISVDEITASMQRSTSEGGKYFGSMDEQSQTTTGKLSTLKDEFLSATGSLTESLIPALQSGVTWLTNISSWFSNLSEEQRKMILIVMGVLAVLGPALIILGKIISLGKTFMTVAKVIGAVTKATWLFNSALLANPITWIVLGIIALIAIIVLLVKNFDKIKAVVSTVWTVIKDVFGKIGSFIANIFKGIINAYISMYNLLIKGLNLLIKGFLSPFNLIIKGLNLVPGVKIPLLKFAIPNIPKLSVGTNFVQQEGLAYLHQGEAVVPKKYNPAIGGGNANMSSPVYVNVEVQQDKFGNYTNTIKTFSNGSKNSYNYGAS